jgi:outer membrane protein OmpA-like peptidoglycan-associated protein
MKRLITVLGPSALVVGVLCGCGPSRPAEPPVELQNARTAYGRAQSGPAAQNDRSGLIEARQALDAAERKFQDSPDSKEVRTLGYVAQRKAEIAEVDGRMTAAIVAAEQKQKAFAGRSERRANVALDRLGLAAKEEPRGTVITLPNGNIFAKDKAEILPAAKRRLTDIANGLKKVMSEQAPQDVGRKVMIIGYTDDTGTEQHNDELSRRRADAVRDFFAKHGLDANVMETEGRGEANPIANNKSAKGRAQNRRVEIVITHPAPQSPSQ